MNARAAVEPDRRLVHDSTLHPLPSKGGQVGSAFANSAHVAMNPPIDTSTRGFFPVGRVGTPSAGIRRRAGCLDEVQDRVGYEGGVGLLDGVAGVDDFLLCLRAENEPALLVFHVGAHAAAF